MRHGTRNTSGKTIRGGITSAENPQFLAIISRLSFSPSTFAI
jgi:hypothetical protein